MAIARLAVLKYVLASMFVFVLQSSDIYRQDLFEIYFQIKNNHPGVYNTEDVNFVAQLESSYQKALENLSLVCFEKEYQNVLNEFVQSFQDTHVGIRWHDQFKKRSKDQGIQKHFSLSLFDQDSYWVSLPTFALDDKEFEIQKIEFENLLSEIRQLDNIKKIVFDLRGNSGGNSDYGSLIIDTFFGKLYAEQQRGIYNRLVSVDWRASYDNVAYVQNLALKLNNFWLANCAQGMQNSLQNNQIYYHEAFTEPKSETILSNKVTATIFVIIDNHNVSAALDFLDELKMMDYPVTFIGQTTKADRVYMEICTIFLPSGLGTFYFPIKKYCNRKRGDNEPYYPNIFVDVNCGIEALQSVVRSLDIRNL